MAAKPSTAAEEALQKIQEQVTCGICLDSYKQPKLLKCFHVYCEQCLQRLVRGGASLPCPQCRKMTPLPVGGVSDLQGAFYIHYLFDIQDALKKVSSSKQTMCKTCKKREAVGFCRSCGFVCAFCEEHHQYWDNLKPHEIIDLDTLTGDVTTLVPPLKKTLFCASHPVKKAKLYCETCEELICRDCIVRVHRDHQYDLVTESFAKHEKVIVDSLKPVKEQIATLEGAVKSVDTQCAAVVEQKTSVVAEIHTVMAHLRQVLEVRETELVSQAEQTAQQKLKSLAAQRDRFELQLGQLKSCHDFVEESRRTCSQGEILGMKSPLVKQINELTGSFKPETLALAEQADIRFSHSLPELVKTCQQFGKVYCHSVCPEKCQASGKGIKAALRGQTVTVSVEALDKEGELCLKPVESLSCELVASDGSSQVRGTVKRRNDNRYDISYQPQATGEHQLHILIEEQPILNSPFTVTVLPNLTAPANIIGDLNEPWGIAVRKGGKVVVAEKGCHCVSVISVNGEKKSFGTRGSAPGQFNSPFGSAPGQFNSPFGSAPGEFNSPFGSAPGQFSSPFGSAPGQFSSPFDSAPDQFNSPFGSAPGQFSSPEGVAIDAGGNILVADTGNHRIQQLSSTGKHLRTVGARGKGPLQFLHPGGIAVHPQTHKVYVADCVNHRIQVLNSNLTYSSSFGRKGSNNGEFNYPRDLSTDSDGNVYVADHNNHRIQVFTADGVYLRQFGKKGEGEEELKKPVSIAIDSHNVVYVGELGNKRVSLFSTDGEFIMSFGREGKGPVQFKRPYGLAIDKKGTLYVCDSDNHRIQIFT